MTIPERLLVLAALLFVAAVTVGAALEGDRDSLEQLYHF